VVAAAAVLFAFTTVPANAANKVRVTPLGSHAGEFCFRDRALLFEDPDGTTVLYDAGLTVGAGDTRLPESLDLVLVTHTHGDHLGVARATNFGDGTCGAPAFGTTVPNTNTAEIVAQNDATLVVSYTMQSFMAKKVKAPGGDENQVQVLLFGGSKRVGGVKIAMVSTAHNNNLTTSLLTNGDLKDGLNADGLWAYAGPAYGYILEFSNGLVVYLTGDTGHTSDMKLIVHDYYKPDLAVVNMGYTFTMGPDEAAWAVNNLIQPKSVIPSHSNEAATSGGALIPGSKTASFVSQVVPGIGVHVPLSGEIMEFNANGVCTNC
jgi:L-ascorbate metabolism protein UlaG (beta-lactamase superfamily)